MAPDAPVPTYDQDGNLALGWLVVVRYVPSDGAVVISWSKDGDLYRQSKQGAAGFLPGDLDGITQACSDTLTMLTSPSLL